jgi:hypothetical protein
MKFSMTGQEKGDLLIEVTTWAGLTVHISQTFLTLGDYEKNFLNNDGQQLHKYQQTKQPTTSHLNNGHVVLSIKVSH